MATVPHDETNQKRCQALTQDNKPCQNHRHANTDYCYVHRGLARERCQAFTQSGKPCRKYAMSESAYCNVHQSAESRNEQAAIRDETVAVIYELDALTDQLQDSFG
jgi:prephenate dehydratase